MLGGHAKPKDMSMLEYSRDALAKPLTELSDVMMWIRTAQFDPDRTRSGRWLGPVREFRSAPRAEIRVDGKLDNVSDAGEVSSETPKTGKDSSEGSASESSSPGSSTEQKMPMQPTSEVTCEIPVPEEGLWQHTKYGTFHRGSEKPDSALTKCGRMDTTSLNMNKLTEWPTMSWPRCRACFPR